MKQTIITAYVSINFEKIQNASESIHSNIILRLIIDI